MGWKNVKDHYGIKHIVQVVKDKGICIGSPYIHDLMVISMEGELVKRDDGISNADLKRYQREMDADPVKLREMVITSDTFEKSNPVYTYGGAEIIEKQCEEYGYPNCTHDGCLMYENTFFSDRAEAIKEAMDNNEASIEYGEVLLQEKREALEKAQRKQNKYYDNRKKLTAMIRKERIDV